MRPGLFGSRTVIGTVLLVVALLAGVRSASAADDQDRVSFGNRVVVDENETVGDIVCFFCTVEARGKIQGDVVTFFGSVRTNSTIQGDVVTLGGDVTLNEQAAIDGDLVIFGGNLRKSADARLGQDQVIFPAIIFAIPFLILGGIIWGIAHLVRRRTPVYYIPPSR